MNDILSFLWILGKVLLVAVPVTLVVAYLTLAERKVIGYIQGRIGPNRVGVRGLLQPIADRGETVTKRSDHSSRGEPFFIYSRAAAGAGSRADRLGRAAF